MLLLALVQNYAHAGTTSLQPVRIAAVVNTADIQSAVEYEIVPSFWLEYRTPDFDFDSDDSF